ncbi:hypothetical protein HPB50_001975 [Hyalomma asiaticum]|uniref:Uncharacterized protein n=1 Tax=Hyalomma asiaticum TaxID=266040 RepID=A0ACB7RIB7_HYAAI|nr:hypothetical protein HPB50_001975 [Hyalomma asiaticum]
MFASSRRGAAVYDLNVPEGWHLDVDMDQEQLVAKISAEFSPDQYPAHSEKVWPLLRHILQELHAVFTSDLVHGGVLLEVGCGPCMYTAMAASVAFQHIVMADLVPANVLEVRKWVDAAPDAKDWSPFAYRLAAIEGHADSEQAAADIIARTRHAIREVTLCDISKPGVFIDRRDAPQFDTVVACLCLDSGSVNQAAHERAVANLAGLLKPGGILVASGVTGNTSYTVCTKTFSSLYTTEASVKSSFTKAGLAVERWRSEQGLPCMQSYIKYEATYVIVGRKNRI